MTRIMFQGCFVIMFCFFGSAMGSCQGPYLDLCGYYENEFNTTGIEDSVESICECQEVKFCYIVDLSEECNSTVIKLTTNGNFTLNQLQCDIQPLDSGMKTPGYELVNQTEVYILMNIITESSFGRYKISCLVFEIIEENITNTEWEVVSVDPAEVPIDTEIKLKVAVLQQINSPGWCFVKTPDNTTEVLFTAQISDTEITCLCFKASTPGIYQVSVQTTITSTTFDKSVNVSVVSKHPVAERAEYGNDFEMISVYFDANIELHSSCADVFDRRCVESFGKDFDCSVRGNALVVKMGYEFQVLDNVLISPGNKICRAGSYNLECLSAPAVNLVLSKPELIGPSLSLITNPSCSNPSEKYTSITLIPPKHSSYIIPNKTQSSPGKTQRKNLMMWRTMRKIQNQFSSRLIMPQTNTTEVLSLLEDLSANELDSRESSSGSASVSIFVQSFPGSSSIVAEASVTFCEGDVRLYKYRWIVNKEIFEDGKVLVLENLTSGKYIIKCLIVGGDSIEILGQGWTTTEILPTIQKSIITPLEATIGTTDSITLHAITWPRTSISWSCRTSLGQVCTTTDQKLANEVLDLASPTISIPAGTFPVGEYVWSVEDTEGANTSRVFIKPGNRVEVVVDVSTFVKPSEEVVLLGRVKGAGNNCRAWWSSVREKGFSYLNVNNMREKEETSKNLPVEEIDLTIPPSSENRKGLESNSLYLFKLQVFCPPHSLNNPNGSLDYIKVPLNVNNSTTILPFIVEPLEGFAMITNFAVSGGEVDSFDGIFLWSYVDSCDEETVIKRGAFARNFTTYLPPGDVKLKLSVCNGRGICATAVTPTVKVIQESVFPSEHFQNARNQIQFLLSSGDTLEALGLAITVFKSLALIPEPEFREMMFSTVGNGIREKIKALTKRMQSDVKPAKLYLEFYKQAVAVAKYFRKGSDVLVLLNEFKNRIMRMNSKN